MDETIPNQPHKERQNDFWDELPEHVKRSINEAKAEIDRGEGIPHAVVMAEVRAIFLNG